MKREVLHAVPKAVELATGERKHPATYHRWRIKGIKGERLETLLVGGRRKTSVEAVLRFVERVTAAADEFSSPANPTSRQREASIARAERELEQTAK